MQTAIIGWRARVGSHLSARLQTVAGAVVAALLGAILIWGVGFSQIAAVHNGAHDVRHSAAFPCH
jgi:cobalt transporter subunit CbtB